MHKRVASVAGMFYPDSAPVLHEQIAQLFKTARTIRPVNIPKPSIRALIVPHAGYMYSGLTAAIAYQTLYSFTQVPQTLVVIGPSHHYAFSGVILPQAQWFQTPLGDIPINTEKATLLQQQFSLIKDDQAHQPEHSLEVQLPFLQYILKDSIQLLPLLCGLESADKLAALFQYILSWNNTLLVISTDLSHFLDYETARQRDQQTAEKIMNYHYQALEYEDACGRVPLAGMLCTAKQTGLTIQQLDLRNSGDTAGDKNRVVGYGAWVLEDRG